MLSHSTEQLDSCFAALGALLSVVLARGGNGHHPARNAPRAGRALLACGVRGIVTPAPRFTFEFRFQHDESYRKE